MSEDLNLEPVDGNVYKTLHQLLVDLDNSSPLKGLILTHRQADPDALCAAGALKLLLETTHDGSALSAGLIVPQGASVLGKQVSALLGIEFSEKIDDNSFAASDFVIVVDTGDPKLLEPYETSFETSKSKKLVIDHHASSLNQETWKNLSNRIVVTESTSTCEIITLGFPREMITRKVADLLLTGLLFDSQHLGIATKRTLEAALILVNAGSEISKCKKMLRHDPERSEILGKIKAAQRMRYDEAAGRIIARSEISSFHAAVARMLIEIGADVGIAYGESGGEARLSARSTQSFFKETGIDLSKEIRKLAEHYNMVGGGHSTAASISGTMEAGVLADSLVQSLKSILLQK